MALLVFACLFVFFTAELHPAWVSSLPILKWSSNRTSSLLKWILNPFVFLRVYKLKQMIIKKQASDAKRLCYLSSSLCLLCYSRSMFVLVPRLELIEYFFHFWIWFLAIFKNSFSWTPPPTPIPFQGLCSTSTNIYLGLPCVSPEMVNIFCHMCRHW